MDTSDLVEKRSIFAEVSDTESALIGKPLEDFCKVYDFTPRRCDTLIAKARCNEFWSYMETRADIVFAETRPIEGAVQSAIAHIRCPKTEGAKSLPNQSRDSKMRFTLTQLFWAVNETDCDALIQPSQIENIDSVVPSKEIAREPGASMSKRPSKNGNSRKSPDYRNDIYAGFDLSTFVPYINKVRMLLKHDKTFPKLVRTTPGDIDYKTLKETMFMSVLPGHEQEPEAVEKLKRPWLAAMQSITVLGADNAARMHINPCRDCITGMIANHDVSYKPFDGEHDMKTLIKDMKRFDREVLSRLELEKRGLPRQVYKMITFGAK